MKLFTTLITAAFLATFSIGCTATHATVATPTQQANLKTASEDHDTNSGPPKVEKLAGNTTCYQVVRGETYLQRCACISEHNGHFTLSEVTCVYPKVMGIPINIIMIDPPEQQTPLPKIQM